MFYNDTDNTIAVLLTVKVLLRTTNKVVNCFTTTQIFHKPIDHRAFTNVLRDFINGIGISSCNTIYLKIITFMKAINYITN